MTSDPGRREHRLLLALASMAVQCLQTKEGYLDSLSMHAGETAIAVLEEYGLARCLETRFGEWTDEGRSFLKADLDERTAMLAAFMADEEDEAT